jgi:hypothetical protein
MQFEAIARQHKPVFSACFSYPLVTDVYVVWETEIHSQRRKAMNLNAVRAVLMPAIIAVALLSNGVTPVAAASQPSMQAAIASVQPLQCYWDGVAYPLGSRRPALYGGYWQCELVARVAYTGPDWVFHSS